MDRQKRNDLLAWLVIYRLAYARRSRYDSEPVMTVSAAVAYAEQLTRSADGIDQPLRIG